MPKCEIFVVGASAGGTEALRELVGGLPEDFSASVLVVLHIGKGVDGLSALPMVVRTSGRLPAEFAEDGERIRPGRIYLAKPDLHMTIEDGHLRVFYGPKENLTRPAINPLFRSAAAAYGNGVAGVILSGLLDDGVAGLAEIKRWGGIAVVQDPQTALFRGMPETALEYIDADYVLAPAEMGKLMTELANKDHPAGQGSTAPPTRVEPLKLTCPECGGPLWGERQGRVMEYKCRVGHTYSPLSLSRGQDLALERALWNAILALEESAEIAERVCTADSSNSFALKRKEAAALRKMLDGLHNTEFRNLPAQ